MRRSGDQCVSALARLGAAPQTSPHPRAVLSSLADLDARCGTAQQLIGQRQRALNQSLVQSQDALSNLREMLEWVGRGEGAMGGVRPVSLDRAVLTQQIQVGRL